jgi:hypothetical protein
MDTGVSVKHRSFAIAEGGKRATKKPKTRPVIIFISKASSKVF